MPAISQKEIVRAQLRDAEKIYESHAARLGTLLASSRYGDQPDSRELQTVESDTESAWEKYRLLQARFDEIRGSKK